MGRKDEINSMIENIKQQNEELKTEKRFKIAQIEKGPDTTQRTTFAPGKSTYERPKSGKAAGVAERNVGKELIVWKKKLDSIRDEREKKRETFLDAKDRLMEIKNSLPEACSRRGPADAKKIRDYEDKLGEAMIKMNAEIRTTKKLDQSMN